MHAPRFVHLVLAVVAVAILGRVVASTPSSPRTANVLTGQSVDVCDYAVDDERLTIRHAFEAWGRHKVRMALNPVLDPARMEVRVKADLDFSKVKTEAVASSGDQHVINYSHRTERYEGTRYSYELAPEHLTVKIAYFSLGPARRAVFPPDAINRVRVDVVFDSGQPPVAPMAFGVLRGLVTTALDIDAARGDEVRVFSR